MDDSQKTIAQLEEEVEQLKIAADMIEDKVERGQIYDRIAQLKGRIAQLKVVEWLEGI